MTIMTLPFLWAMTHNAFALSVVGSLPLKRGSLKSHNRQGFSLPVFSAARFRSQPPSDAAIHQHQAISERGCQPLEAASPFESDHSPHPCNQGAAGFTRCPVASHSIKSVNEAQAPQESRLFSQSILGWFLENQPVINLPRQLHVPQAVVRDLLVTPFAESVIDTAPVHALGLSHPEL